MQEYGSSTRAKEQGKNRIILDEVVDINFGTEQIDPLLVVSLLGTKEDGSREIICVTYLSIVGLIKKQVINILSSRNIHLSLFKA
jgi:hypothetical protein